jgi:hypothetical protein
MFTRKNVAKQFKDLFHVSNVDFILFFHKKNNSIAYGFKLEKLTMKRMTVLFITYFVDKAMAATNALDKVKKLLKL